MSTASNTIWYITTSSGDITMIDSQERINLFTLLRKLGLKTIPNVQLAWTFTTASFTFATDYTVTFSSNTVNVSSPPVPEPQVKAKKKKAFSKFEKKNWRDKWQHHARCTGR